jgi:hypothetical protein
MSAEAFALGILVVLMIAQNIFWARIVLSLSNRLMSRDFNEFAHAKKIEKQKPEKLKPLPSFQEEAIDPEAERQANDLNTLFNMA